MKIHVGYLAPDVTEKMLNDIFSVYGDAFARLMIDRASNRSKGFGFVEMPDNAAAQTAIEALKSKEINGSAIVVTEAPRDWGPYKCHARNRIAHGTKTRDSWCRWGGRTRA